MMKLFVICSLISFSAITLADNYCGVSRHSPTYGMDFNQVDELVWKSKPKASVECGIIENIIGMRTGHIREGHYKSVVLLVDQNDEKFIAFARSGDLTVYTFTSARREVFYTAVVGNYFEGSLLEAGALFVKEFREVTLRNGYSHRLFTLERVL